MTVSKTISKIEKLTGQKIQTNSNGQCFLTFNNRVISFYANGRNTPDAEAICFYTKYVNSQDDMQTDYFSGTFHDNITQAYNFVK